MHWNFEVAKTVWKVEYVIICHYLDGIRQRISLDIEYAKRSLFSLCCSFHLRTLERAAILKTNIIFQVKALQVGILIWEKQIFIAYPVYCIQCSEPNLCGSEHVLVTSECEMKCMKIVQSGAVHATDLN